jgi:putative flippase GtrA
MKAPVSGQIANGRGFSEIRRFVIIGVFNSALTYVLYLLLNLILVYQIAYTVSFVVGILISAHFNARYTFQTTLTVRSLLKFGTVYCLNYFLGLGLLVICIDYFHWPEEAAPIAVLVITVPIGFLGSKYVLIRKP